VVSHQISLSLDSKNILAAIRATHRTGNETYSPLALPIIKKLQGGLNNAVYICADHDETVCVKIYRVDDRHRADREWNALQFLSVYQPALVPKAYWFDPDPEYPAVGMAFVPGEPLSHIPITADILDALAWTLHQLYAIDLTAHPYPFMRIGSVLECLSRIEQWTMQLDSEAERDLVDHIRPLAQSWLQSDDRDTLRRVVRPVFARGDPNLSNCLWDGSTVRLIDLEYAGWSDIAFELADLVEHINSRSVCDEAWESFVAGFIPLGSADYKRFLAAQRTCALLWLVILWPHRHTRKSTLVSQIERMRFLLGKKNKL
jgi:Ser/Thr protein kinase RdoA (MazF antagonist)